MNERIQPPHNQAPGPNGSKETVVVGIGVGPNGSPGLVPEMVARMMTEQPLAIIIVQHGSGSENPAVTAGRIARARIPAVLIRDGMRPAVNTVSLVPAAKTLKLEAGVFRLEPTQGDGHGHLIDTFFESLAETQQERGVAVILPGLGRDGEQGFRAVKTAGGLTILPFESAVPADDTGEPFAGPRIADILVAPENIAKGLKIARSYTRLLSAIRNRNTPPAMFQRILRLLREDCGKDLVHLRSEKLIQAVARRMAICGISTLGDYRRYLETALEERCILCDDLLLTVGRGHRETDSSGTTAACPIVHTRRQALDLQQTVKKLKGQVQQRRAAEAALQRTNAELEKISRQSLKALEADRKSVSKELHDSIGASLAIIKFNLEAQLDHNGDDAVLDTDALQAVIQQLADTIKQSKEIAAYLRPPMLDDFGLIATIGWFCRQLSKRNPGLTVKEYYRVKENEIDDTHKIVCYRVVQEAMTNAVKHGLADQIKVSLWKRKNRLKLKIEDNGVGFDPDCGLSASDPLSGNGLVSIRERTEISGGDFSLSSRPGKGTVVEAVFELRTAS